MGKCEDVWISNIRKIRSTANKASWIAQYLVKFNFNSNSLAIAWPTNRKILNFSNWKSAIWLNIVRNQILCYHFEVILYLLALLHTVAILDHKKLYDSWFFKVFAINIYEIGTNCLTSRILISKVSNFN